eukprot:GHVU01012694.1.p2 GENE.GHVU01012694.1~~GHVU01012694.1.p2  ORF type:complete len:172 (+),score=36.87 GHVU01012694.1:227-742(+)
MIGQQQQQPLLSLGEPDRPAELRPGGGLSAAVKGVSVTVRPHLDADVPMEDLTSHQWVEGAVRRGETVVAVELNDILVARLSFCDTAKAGAARLVRYLQRELGIEVYLCTGDSSAAAAKTIAAEVEIEPAHVISGATPADKLALVEALKQRYQENEGTYVCEEELTSCIYR